MRVTGDEQVDGIVGAIDDIHDRALNPVAFVLAAAKALEATFVDEHDDLFDVSLPQFRDQRIHRVGFVLECEPRDTRTPTSLERRSASQPARDWPPRLPDHESNRKACKR